MSKPKRVTKRQLAVLNRRYDVLTAQALLAAGVIHAVCYGAANPVTETATVDYRGKLIPGKTRVVGFNPEAIEARRVMKSAMVYLDRYV